MGLKKITFLRAHCITLLKPLTRSNINFSDKKSQGSTQSQTNLKEKPSEEQFSMPWGSLQVSVSPVSGKAAPGVLALALRAPRAQGAYIFNP